MKRIYLIALFCAFAVAAQADDTKAAACCATKPATQKTSLDQAQVKTQYPAPGSASCGCCSGASKQAAKKALQTPKGIELARR